MMVVNSGAVFNSYRVLLVVIDVSGLWLFLTKMVV